MTDDRRSRRAALRTLGGVAAALAGCARPAGERSGGSPPATADGPTAGTAAAGAPAATPTDPPTVRIPGGEYTVGTDRGPAPTRPAHAVALAAFRIDRYEVTNAQFAAFLNDLEVTPRRDAAAGAVAPADLPPAWRPRLIEGSEGSEGRPLIALDDEHCRIGVRDGRFAPEAGYRRHPVTEATWIGARAFADWRGARLPTEAEWEAAARGPPAAGDGGFPGRRYPWGEAPPTPERAVYGRGSGETAPVGTHPAGATPAGVQDLAGNVSEWTSTLFAPYPYDAADGREDPAVDGERVTRGGAHVFFDPGELTTVQRSGFSREFDRGHRHIGFRCVTAADDS